MAAITPLGVLFLVFLLEIKHFIFDAPLQTSVMVADKAIYGKTMGLVHAGLHGIGTFIVLPIAGVAWAPAAILALAEAVVHYHLDYSKENFVKSKGWTPRDSRFWWSLATDQALHHFSYLAIALIVVVWL